MGRIARAGVPRFGCVSRSYREGDRMKRTSQHRKPHHRSAAEMTPVFIFLPLFCIWGANASPVINLRPVIGVLTQEAFGKVREYGEAYIPASYIKFLESAGARVAPIRNDLKTKEYKELFSYINGLLLPGGSANLTSSGYAKAAKVFYDETIRAAERGDMFPLWGTCLGFEQLMTITASQNLLQHTDSDNLSLPLEFVVDPASSRIFQHLPPDLIEALGTENITANFHSWSLTPKNYSMNNALEQMYRIVSLNTDNNGIKFISSVEAYNYSIYGVQWHPEKAPFEWNPNQAISHSSNAVHTSFYMAEFFVNEARKNFHRFPNQSMEEAALIYQNVPVYVGNISGFTESYFFSSSYSSIKNHNRSDSP
uniref:gamma-glutamyl hydrolase-like n=2 Tax=Myxine glutinosa TaxID=7769 RepID=UPI00358F6060